MSYFLCLRTQEQLIIIMQSIKIPIKKAVLNITSVKLRRHAFTFEGQLEFNLDF